MLYVQLHTKTPNHCLLYNHLLYTAYFENYIATQKCIRIKGLAPRGRRKLRDSFNASLQSNAGTYIDHYIRPLENITYVCTNKSCLPTQDLQYQHILRQQHKREGAEHPTRRNVAIYQRKESNRNRQSPLVLKVHTSTVMSPMVV